MKAQILFLLFMLKCLESNTILRVIGLWWNCQSDFIWLRDTPLPAIDRLHLCDKCSQRLRYALYLEFEFRTAFRWIWSSLRVQRWISRLTFQIGSFRNRCRQRSTLRIFRYEFYVRWSYAIIVSAEDGRSKTDANAIFGALMSYTPRIHVRNWYLKFEKDAAILSAR